MSVPVPVSNEKFAKTKTFAKLFSSVYMGPRSNLLCKKWSKLS